MGSACSSDEETHRHRENKKNRNNPTEAYDTWKQKMLLDIGADPLAVIRDFPRMTVYVGTATHHNYLPAGAEQTRANGKATITAAATGDPSRRPSENPLAPSSSALLVREHERSGGDEGNDNNNNSGHEHQHRHHYNNSRNPQHQGNGPDQRRPPPCVDTTGGANRRNSNNPTPAVSPGPSAFMSSRLYTGGRTSQREPFRDDDAFATRMKRVREEVLLLSQLCDERATFGAAFELAWDRLVAQGNNDCAVDSEAAGEYLAAFQPQQESRNLMSSMTRRNNNNNNNRNSIALDVHQVLLNACVDSGMIALVDDQAHTVPVSTIFRGIGVNATAQAGPTPPPPPTGTSPAGVSRSSRPESRDTSALQLLAATTAPTYPSEEAAVDHGGKGNTKKAKGKGGTMPERDGVTKSSSNSQIRSAASFPTAGTPAVVSGNTSRYVVRSATFHLMQFATQGVMFFPVQRLKHVLWMPWSSHMQDISWTIHITLKDAVSTDLIAVKQHTLNELYNNASTVLSNEANAADVVGLADGGLQNATSAMLAATKNKFNSNSEQTADAFGAMAATPALLDTDVRVTSMGGMAPSRNGTNTHTNSTNGAAEHKGNRKIIVIQHVQTGRHYVEDADRKTTPRYELDWACSIRIDQDILQETFAPFQKYATSPHNGKPSLLLGDTANWTLPNLERRAVKSEDAIGDVAAASNSLPDHLLQREETNDEGPYVGSTANVRAVEGIASARQPALLQREVIVATVEIVAARVERPPRTMCMVSSKWKKRKEELGYVLEQQYNVELEEKDELYEKRVF